MSDKTPELTRRRILAGIGTVGAASAAAGAGTMALFSDSESSANNDIQAGTLNLDADANHDDGDGSATKTLSVQNAHPGESGAQADTLANTGSVDGLVSLKFGRGTNNQNGNEEPEPVSNQPGDLGDVLGVTVKVGGTTVRSGTFNGVFDGTREFYTMPSLPTNNNKNLRIEWAIPSWAGNHIQGDTVTADIDITLLQQGAGIERFADVVVESDENIANYNGGNPTGVVPEEASDGDTVLVKDGYDKNTWNPIYKSVTLVSESKLGATAGRFSVKAPDVAIVGFDVESDGDDYNGISVEPENGADSGVVIRDNKIHDVLDDNDPSNGENKKKQHAYGILVWDTGTPTKDLVVARNRIEDIGDGQEQGFGVFVEGQTFSTRGVTIENNVFNSIDGYTDGDTSETFPGVAVAIQPELTDPGYSTSNDEANAVVWGNTVGNTHVGVSLAGRIQQVVVADNDLSGAGHKVLTKGNDPDEGDIGIVDLQDSQTVVQGTARYIQ